MNTGLAERAQKLHNGRGYKVRLLCNNCVRARRLGVVPREDERTVTVKVLYVGAASGKPDRLQPPDDPHVYTHLCSPFPEELRQYLTWNLFRDGEGGLWASFYSHVYLKDPAIFESGLRIDFEVPGILAVKKPLIQIEVDNDMLYSETVDTAGVHTVVLQVRDVDAATVRYMQEVRRQQRILLAEFKRVCEKLGLTWYLVCGGLIGAMREGDLIPWDDDLDVAMPRKDYDLLCAAAKREWPDGADFLLLRPEDYGKNAFLDFMTRLVYQKETIDSDPFERMEGRGRQDIRRHLPMDIYILDEASGTAWIHRMRVRKIQLLYVLAIAHRGSFEAGQHQEYGKSALCLVRFLQMIGKRLPVRWLLKRWEKTARRLRGRSTGVLFQSNGYYRCLQDRYPAAWFREGKPMQICGITVQIPAEPDLFLRKMYGNYMCYGPIWDRIPKHRDHTVF